MAVEKDSYSIRDERAYIIAALLFGCTTLMCKVAGDDAVQIYNGSKNILHCIKWGVDQYWYWSSRQLINALWMIILQYGKVALAVYTSLSAYIYMKAVRLLFVDEETQGTKIIVISSLFLYPVGLLTTAGWYAAITSYFGPQMFGLMALVPIKKIIKNQGIGFWEGIGFIICILYGGNAEQMSVVLLFLYMIAIVYILLCKMWDKIKGIALYTAVSLFDFVYFITCPGNWNRDTTETASFFPTFGMLDIIDKLDIGVSTTLKWLYVDSQIFFIVFSIMIALLIAKKYKNIFFTILGMLPTFFLMMLGPLNNILNLIFPSSNDYSKEINFYGSFVPSKTVLYTGSIQFFLFLFITICFLIDLVLLNDTIEGLIVDICLLVIGVGSRVMIGLTPNIYVSSYRTFTSMVVCIFAVMIHVYTNGKKYFEYTYDKSNERYNSVYGTICYCMFAGFGVMGMWNWLMLVGTSFR